ncbi:MAG: glycosyl transferase, partial [Acidimicrobiales bacterium]|nr:glycosyl transferase [Acidimicrobiales bacterium]
LDQDYGDVVEILVIDGGSTDGTREIVIAEGHPVRLVDNPRVTAAAAMNVGIGEAKGDVICRADAHTIYGADYIRRCVDALTETEADNVGGPMRPVGTTSFGRAVAAVTSSVFGVGPARFHYGTAERADVDTVYLGCWLRQTLEDIGGYDESQLQWAAEDQELNFRIRQRGGRVVLDPTIRSWYFPRETVRGLYRQYKNYGVAKASTLAKHRSLPTWRPLAPAALVAGSTLAAFGGRRWRRAVIPLAHAAALGAAALSLGRQPGVAPHRAWIAMETCHWSYGFGFWTGFGRILRGRGFDTRPRGHR